MENVKAKPSKQKKKKHICPLQFDIVERLMNYLQNKGEIVGDPLVD